MEAGSQASSLPKRGALALGLRIGVTAALVGVAVYIFDWGPVVDGMRSAEASVVAAAFGAYLLAALAMAERWRRMLAIDGADVPLSTCFRLYLESFLVGLALPSFVGGDAYRAVRVRRQLDSSARVAVNVVAERIIGSIALFALAAVGMVAYQSSLDGWGVGARLGGIAGVVVVGLLGVAAATRIERLRPHVAQAKAYLTQSGAALLILSSTAHVLGATSVYFCAVAVGIAIPFPFYVVLLPALWVLSLVPALGGIGPKEGGLIVALTGSGVTEGVAMAAAALVLASRLFASVLGGASLLVGKQRTL